MAIRLLCQYGIYPPNTIVRTLDSGTETGLIARGEALANLTGGVEWSAPNTPAYTVPVLAELDPDTPTVPAALNAGGATVFSGAQVGALQAMVSGAWNRPGRRPVNSAASISLPAFVERAAWWPLDEASGTTFTDRVGGLVLTHQGTATNLHSAGFGVCLDTAAHLRLYNSSAVSDLFRLDTLDGSLIVGLQRTGSAPSAACAIWGYGDTANSAVGGFTGRLQATNVANFNYCAVGGTNVDPSFYLQGELLTKDIRHDFWVIHRIGGVIYVDGYEGDFQVKSCRYRSAESAPPGAATAQGVRFGARPSGTSGAGAAQWSSQMTLGRIANICAIRLSGDQRHNIPAYIADMAKTMPLGLTPRILAGG